MHFRWNYVLLAIFSIFFMNCQGQKLDLSGASSLGDTIVDDGSRTDGSDLGSIYNVTMIVSATPHINEWTNAELPFAPPSRPRQAMGENYSDTQTPFKFEYTYPPNNYKLTTAHILMDTSRDSSDTEGIFIDGVFTGRVPGSMVGTSPMITHRHYFCAQQACAGATAPASPTNTYYMDWALTHYKQNTVNTFDLDVEDLLAPTSLSPVGVVSDGVVRVVTGDDSPVYKALLVLEGITISKTPLTCSNSPNYTFSNVYIHNDGNSISQAAFSGTVVAPNTSWSSGQAGFRSVEFYYDPKLPRVSTDFITITSATVNLRVKRQASGTAAIVVNGVGIAEAGFDRSTATVAVERWIDTASVISAWTSFVSSIPATNTDTTTKIYLASIFGADTMKELLSQGKLNISLAGSLGTAYGQAATSGRTYGVTVAGPELALQGTFYTEICTVPNNPDSPLNDNGDVPTGLDGASPIISSIQVVNITQNSATIQWLTNEPATTQVGYGLGNTDTNTTLDSTLSVFHSVTVTGLSPYKFYTYVVKSQDGSANLTISGAKVFRTLR